MKETAILIDYRVPYWMNLNIFKSVLCEKLKILETYWFFFFHFLDERVNCGGERDLGRIRHLMCMIAQVQMKLNGVRFVLIYARDAIASYTYEKWSLRFFQLSFLYFYLASSNKTKLYYTLLLFKRERGRERDMRWDTRKSLRDFCLLMFCKYAFTSLNGNATGNADRRLPQFRSR